MSRPGKPARLEPNVRLALVEALATSSVFPDYGAFHRQLIANAGKFASVGDALVQAANVDKPKISKSCEVLARQLNAELKHYVVESAATTWSGGMPRSTVLAGLIKHKDMLLDYLVGKPPGQIFASSVEVIERALNFAAAPSPLEAGQTADRPESTEHLRVALTNYVATLVRDKLVASFRSAVDDGISDKHVRVTIVRWSNARTQREIVGFSSPGMLRFAKSRWMPGGRELYEHHFIAQGAGTIEVTSSVMSTRKVSTFLVELNDVDFPHYFIVGDPHAGESLSAVTVLVELSASAGHLLETCHSESHRRCEFVDGAIAPFWDSIRLAAAGPVQGQRRLSISSLRELCRQITFTPGTGVSLVLAFPEEKSEPADVVADSSSESLFHAMVSKAGRRLFRARWSQDVSSRKTWDAVTNGLSSSGRVIFHIGDGDRGVWAHPFPFQEATDVSLVLLPSDSKINAPVVIQFWVRSFADAEALKGLLDPKPEALSGVADYADVVLALDGKSFAPGEREDVHRALGEWFLQMLVGQYGTEAINVIPAPDLQRFEVTPARLHALGDAAHELNIALHGGRARPIGVMVLRGERPILFEPRVSEAPDSEQDDTNASARRVFAEQFTRRRHVEPLARLLRCLPQEFETKTTLAGRSGAKKRALCLDIRSDTFPRAFRHFFAPVDTGLLDGLSCRVTPLKALPDDAERGWEICVERCVPGAVARTVMSGTFSLLSREYPVVSAAIPCSGLDDELHERGRRAAGDASGGAGLMSVLDQLPLGLCWIEPGATSVPVPDQPELDRPTSMGRDDGTGRLSPEESARLQQLLPLLFPDSAAPRFQYRTPWSYSRHVGVWRLESRNASPSAVTLLLFETPERFPVDAQQPRSRNPFRQNECQEFRHLHRLLALSPYRERTRHSSPEENTNAAIPTSADPIPKGPARAHNGELSGVHGGGPR